MSRAGEKVALAEVEEAVVGFIREGRGEFEGLLERVVEYQRSWTPPLDRLWGPGRFTCNGRGAWASLPGVPTEAFRRMRLVSGEFEAGRVFRTSGTTSGARGEHWRISTRAYDEGCVAWFRRAVLEGAGLAGEATSGAEGCGEEGAFKWIPLVFDPAAVPDSSLSYMVGRFAAGLGGGSGVRYLLGEGGVDVAAAGASLGSGGGPKIVIATAFALVELFDAWGGSVRLPEGSLVVETGGLKGRVREVSRAELRRAIGERLGVPEGRIVGEYSMTELSSQLWEGRLWKGGAREGLVPPPWCRVVAVEPESLEPVEGERSGLLKFVDLANVDSVVCVQSLDVGRVRESGEVVLEGRAAGAVSRGCSLAVEEIVRRAGRGA